MTPEHQGSRGAMAMVGLFALTVVIFRFLDWLVYTFVGP